MLRPYQAGVGRENESPQRGIPVHRPIASKQSPTKTRITYSCRVVGIIDRRRRAPYVVYVVYVGVVGVQDRVHRAR